MRKFEKGPNDKLKKDSSWLYLNGTSQASPGIIDQLVEKFS